MSATILRGERVSTMPAAEIAPWEEFVREARTRHESTIAPLRRQLGEEEATVRLAREALAVATRAHVETLAAIGVHETAHDQALSLEEAERRERANPALASFLRELEIGWDNFRHKREYLRQQITNSRADRWPEIAPLFLQACRAVADLQLAPRQDTMGVEIVRVRQILQRSLEILADDGELTAADPFR